MEGTKPGRPVFAGSLSRTFLLAEPSSGTTAPKERAEPIYQEEDLTRGAPGRPVEVHSGWEPEPIARAEFFGLTVATQASKKCNIAGPFRGPVVLTVEALRVASQLTKTFAVVKEDAYGTSQFLHVA